MWWWNKEVKDTIARKKAAFKELCRFPSEENETKYKCLRYHTRIIVAIAKEGGSQTEVKLLM